VQAADFTKLAWSGKYYLDVPGAGRSWNFEIGPDKAAGTMPAIMAVTW
jgi:hypothetical protein